MIQSSAELVASAISRIGNLSPEAAMEAVSNGERIMLDLREQHELETVGSFPGAIHIPRGMLEFAVDPAHPAFVPDITPDKAIVLACASGGRSALATETLLAMGFSDVVNLSGGFSAWKAQGLPTV